MIQRIAGALGARAAAVTAVAAHAGPQAGVQVGQQGHRAALHVHVVEHRVLAGAVFFAGAGRHHDVVAHEFGGVHMVFAAQLHLPAFAGLHVVYEQAGLLGVHPLVVAAVVQGQAQLLAVFQPLHLHVFRCDGLVFAGLGVAQIHAAALFVHHALAVEPEGQLVEDLIVLLFLDLLQGFFPLLALQPFGRDGVVIVHADAQEQVVPQGDQVAGGEGQGKILLRLAAAGVDFIEYGIVQALFGLGLVFARAVAREQHRAVIQPREGSFGAAARELAHLPVFQQVDIGYVFVGLHLGLAHHKGHLFATGGTAQLREEFDAGKILNGNLLHKNSPPSQ